MRFDVLLHELRLFKSRSQATAAIQDGLALLDGAKTKPSREVHAGQRVTLIGDKTSRTVEVLDIPRGNVSKERAKEFVRDVTGG